MTRTTGLLLLTCLMPCGCVSVGLAGVARTGNGIGNGWTIDADFELFSQTTLSVASIGYDDPEEAEVVLAMLLFPWRRERFDSPVNDACWGYALRAGDNDTFGLGMAVGYKLGWQKGTAQVWIRPVGILWLGKVGDESDPAAEGILQSGVGLLF